MPIFIRPLSVLSLCLTSLFLISRGNSSSSNESLANTMSHLEETKVTENGHVFTRDYSNPKLGEAWKDEYGTIWGNQPKSLMLSHKEATEYCKSIGARLPSDEEFSRLYSYMLEKGSFKYKPQPEILPNLNCSEQRFFWSGTTTNCARRFYTCRGLDYCHTALSEPWCVTGK